MCSGVIKFSNLCTSGIWDLCLNSVYLVYNGNYEVGIEVFCDGFDNDCGGGIDEDFFMI